SVRLGTMGWLAMAMMPRPLRWETNLSSKRLRIWGSSAMATTRMFFGVEVGSAIDRDSSRLYLSPPAAAGAAVRASASATDVIRLTACLLWGAASHHILPDPALTTRIRCSTVVRFMLSPDSQSRKRIWSWLPGLLLVLVCSAGVLGALKRATPDLTCPDGYFHIRYAEVLRTEGLSRTFPWWQETFLRDHWADKDFMLHV